MMQMPNATRHAWLPRLAVASALTLVVGAGSALAAYRTITRSDAKAIANAIELRHSDLPDLKQQPNPTTAEDKREDAELTKCAGSVPDSEALVNAQSPNFVSTDVTGTTISSSVEILPTAALVAKDLVATLSTRGLGCFKTALETEYRAVKQKGESVTTTVALLPSVVPSSDHGFRLRVTLLINAKQGSTVISVPIYIDAVGVAYGQIELGVDYFETRRKPSSALETQLMKLMLTRAKAATG